MVVAAPAAETPLPIQVSRLDALPPHSFVRVRGLPPAVALSQGHSVAPGSWAIPLQALATLRIAAPVGSSGRSALTISLVTIDGEMLAETTAQLVLTSASALVQGLTDQAPPRPKALAAISASPLALLGGPRTATAEEARTAPPSPPPNVAAGAPSGRTLASEVSARAQRHLSRGRELQANGDIATARLFYRKAADIGLATAALALAATYDPAELSRMKAHGLRGDEKEARRWYEKARELGAADAESHLARLDAR